MYALSKDFKMYASSFQRLFKILLAGTLWQCSCQGRYLSARDQLVALWTSWIEAKNYEDGAGCHGGGGGDEDEDAEGAPSGRAPTPPPLNCCNLKAKIEPRSPASRRRRQVPAVDHTTELRLP